MSKKKQSDQLEQSEFCIIKGGKDDDTYGLGDPCIPLDISYIPDKKPKSPAPSLKVYSGIKSV